MKNLLEFLINKKINKLVNTPKFIDLGLPSKTLWCDRNLGAEDIYDPGNYYQWGDNKPITQGTTYEQYKFKVKNSEDEYSKYCKNDNKLMLDSKDDVATKINKAIRIPSDSYFKELIMYTKSNRKTDEYGNVYFELESLFNHKKLIIPLGGFYNTHHSTIIKKNKSLRLWSNMCNETFDYGITLLNDELNKNKIKISASDRLLAVNIRPIKK